jgi:opacity protein-like surface antigen
MILIGRWAAVLSLALFVGMTPLGAQNSSAADDDILIIEDGGDDILIIEEDGGGANVQELEDQFDRLADELDELRDRFGSVTRNVNVTGYGEVHFNLPTDGRRSEFDAHRFVLGVNARFTDWIFLSAEIDYEHGAQELEFEMGYLDFLIDPRFNVRAGVVLIPVGFLNEFHEPVLFWTVERPLLQNKLIPTSWNGTGAGFFGTLGNFLGGMNYRFYVVNSLQSVRPDGFSSGSGTGKGGNSGRFRAESGIRSGRLQPNKAIGEDIALTGRVEFTNLFPGFQLGGSFYTGNTTHNLIEAGGRVTLLEADIKYRKKWFEMNASIVNIHVNDAEIINQFMATQVGPTPTPVGGGNQNVASNMLGYNVQFGVHVPQLLQMGTTQDFVVHFMYEFIDTQNDAAPGFVKLPQHERDVFTTGVVWFPTPNVAVKMDYTHIDYAALGASAGLNQDDVNLGIAYMFF